MGLPGWIPLRSRKLQSGVQGKLTFPPMNRNACIRKNWQSIRDRSASGRKMVGNRLKSSKKPLPTSLVGRRFLMLQRKLLADQNALTTVTGRRQLTTLKTILRPLTKIVRSCKEVGDRTLRRCDHANTGSICHCYAYAQVHIQHYVPRKWYLMSLFIWNRSVTSPRTVANYWRKIKYQKKNLLPTSLVGKRFSMQL